MARAIEQIVGAYVRLSNRQALEDLLSHRQRLRVDLKGAGNLDDSLAIRDIDEDVAAIRAGLEILQGQASSS